MDKIINYEKYNNFKTITCVLFIAITAITKFIDKNK